MQLIVEEERNVMLPAESMRVSGIPGTANGRQGVEREHCVMAWMVKHQYVGWK